MLLSKKKVKKFRLHSTFYMIIAYISEIKLTSKNDSRRQMQIFSKCNEN